MQETKVASKKKSQRIKRSRTKDVCRVVLSAPPPPPALVDLEPSDPEEVGFEKCLL